MVVFVYHGGFILRVCCPMFCKIIRRQRHHFVRVILAAVLSMIVVPGMDSGEHRQVGDYSQFFRGVHDASGILRGWEAFHAWYCWRVVI